jgi:hypothetical protein
MPASPVGSPPPSMRGRLRRVANAGLATVGLALVRQAELDWLRGQAAELEQLVAVESRQPTGLPPEVEAELRADHPRLRDYSSRYAGHPAATHSLWSRDYVDREVDFRRFRDDNAYVWQRGTVAAQYGLTAYYARAHDHRGLLERLTEDRLFGVRAYDVDGLLVTRDLLDSVAELTFIDEQFELSASPGFTILDIGAGYGRFAHRATAAFSNVRCLCTDAVPVSSFLCDFYLGFRQVPRAEVVPLDEVENSLRDERIDLAVNVHSFSECPTDAIAWWLDVLATNQVPALLVVPNTGTELLSREVDGSSRDFLPLIESRGYERVAIRPKYAESPFVQRFGLYPSHYVLFRRRP